MSKPTYRYLIQFGLRGCYMPDSTHGAYKGHTRRGLAALIRGALDFYHMPAARFGDVGITRLWSFIKRNGSSSAHFTLDAGDGNCLMFSGLTEEEYAEQQEQDE